MKATVQYGNTLEKVSFDKTVTVFDEAIAVRAVIAVFGYRRGATVYIDRLEKGFRVNPNNTYPVMYNFAHGRWLRIKELPDGKWEFLRLSQ